MFEMPKCLGHSICASEINGILLEELCFKGGEGLGECCYLSRDNFSMGKPKAGRTPPILVYALLLPLF